MNQDILNKVDRLIKIKKIDEAQSELSRLGTEFLKNSEYLYLRSKIFYIKRLNKERLRNYVLYNIKKY